MAIAIRKPTPKAMENNSKLLSMLPCRAESTKLIKTITLGSAMVTKNENKNTANAMNPSELCLGKSPPIATPIGSILTLTPVRKKIIPIAVIAVAIKKEIRSFQLIPTNKISSNPIASAKGKTAWITS